MVRGLLQHPKRRGEWVELNFMTRVAGLDLQVLKPWGDSARYDVGVERRRRGWRSRKVQVKSTMCRAKGSGRSYVCSVHPNQNGRAYRRGEFDFLAAYVIPEDVWYIIPAPVVMKGNMNMLVLSPSVPGHRYERYKEAWHLLTGKRTKKRRRKGVVVRRRKAQPQRTGRSTKEDFSSVIGPVCRS